MTNPTTRGTSSLPSNPAPDSQRLATVSWAARMGAITAEALAHRLSVSPASARGRLAAAVRAGLLRSSRPLYRSPALYTATARGIPASGQSGLTPCRVTPSNASHLIACAAVAAVIERRHPVQPLWGERELRLHERHSRSGIASATLRVAGVPRLHRPDLVLWPASAIAPGCLPGSMPGASSNPGTGAACASGTPHSPVPLPISIEVELTLKAVGRLEDICKAWARCRLVDGVLYLASSEVAPAVARAIANANACDRVAVLPLEPLLRAIS